MTLNLRMVLQADSASAKGALDETARGIKGVTAATAEQATKSRTAASAADTEAAAKRRNAQASREVATANRQAAGATGNLVAQLNDVGMMLAAGQNPLQLAIQQGSQITQVIGPMGAAGAVSMLGTALVQLVNPINLVTFGIIAGGAAAVKWLTGATEDARTLEDQINAVNEAVKAWRDESGKSFDDLRKDFGAITPELVAMQRELNQLRLADILAEADAAARQLSDTMGAGLFASAGGDIRRLFLESGIALGTTQMQQFKAALDAVGNATGVRDQLAAVQALRQQFASITGGIQNMSEGQRAFYGTLLDTEAALRRAAVATGDVDQKTQDAVLAATELAQRAQAVVAAIASADGSNLVAAFQSAFPVASQLLGMAQGIIATIGAAQAQAAAWDSAQMGGLAAQYAQYGAGRAIGERLARESGALYGGRRVIPAPVVGSSGAASGSGGGAAAARDEADALQELIASLEAEIDALRVQDPIQQEMLRHREALAGATDVERQKVEDLIATREREKAALESLREISDMTGNALIDALMGADDAGKRLVETLIRAGLEAALLGKGPLAGLFGGEGSGGFLGMLFGSILPVGKAEGGLVTGPGTGTSDSIPAMLSNGEYVVNARATSQNRTLLEAINRGSVTRFAGGGYVGGSRSPGLPGAGGSQRPMVQIINQSQEPIREEQGSGPDAEGMVTLIVGRAIGQGRLDRQNRSRFGLTPKVASR